MHWGVFHTEAGDKHVAPCDGDHEVADGHFLILYCWCKPIRDPLDPLVIIHQDADA
jgi:hypothetical protein